jgi:hypothetical protein
MIDFSSLTHIIIFPAQDALSTSPYFDSSKYNPGGDFTNIVAAAHAKGCKVLLSVVGGYGQTVMPVVAKDLTKCQTFVNSAISYMVANHCDGIEIDWEFPRSADAAGWHNLITMFRTALDAQPVRGVLVTSAFYCDLGNPPYVVSDMNTRVDFVLPMTYTMWMGTSQSPYTTGYDTPVNPPTQWLGYKGYALSAPRGGGPLSYLDDGYTPSKTAIAMSFCGCDFSGTTGMGKSYSSYTFCSSVTKPLPAGYGAIPATGRAWDATAQAAYCLNGTHAYSFQTVQSVTAIVSWAKLNGFGAIMIYDLGCGYETATGTTDSQALLHAVWNTAQGGILPITISSFGMTLVGGQAIATFTVLTEEAVYKYDIQRRPVGGQWTSRGSVFPFGAPHTYVFTDTSVPLGVWQYRIEEVDLDGETTDFMATAGLTDVIDKVGVVTHAIPQRSTK